MSNDEDNHGKVLSIIIVNYNSGELLTRTVESILDSGYPLSRLELIIVDNGSKDNSLINLKTKNEAKSDELFGLNIIRNTENEGWCKAINLGLRQARGDVIIFSNHDVIYSKGSISKVIFHLNNRKDVGICQFNSFLPTGEPDVAAAYLDPLGYAYSFIVSEPTLVTFGEAVAIAIKKDVVDKIGNLDDDYFIEYEDQDFCWRALLHGYKILFIPEAIVHHYRGTVEKPNFFVREKRVYLYTRNHINTLIKNLELHNLLRYLPQVLLIEVCKALFVLFVRRNFRLAAKIFEGIVAPFLILPSLSRKRKKIQKSRSVPDEEVLKYFVPFMPVHQLNYLKYQSSGQRYVLDNQLLLKVLANKEMS